MIPKEVLDELGPIEPDEEYDEIKVILEKHQARLRIPTPIRLMMNLKKGDVFQVIYDENTGDLTYFRKGGFKR